MSAGTLPERVAAVEGDVRSLRRGYAFSNLLTLVVGVAVLGGLAYFFHYGFGQITPMLAPDMVVAFAENKVTENVPEARKYAEEFVKESSPAWAVFASDSARSSMPMLREQALVAAVAALDSHLQSGKEASRDVVSQYFRTNRKLVAEGIEKLSSDPKVAEQFVSEISVEFGKQLGGDLKEKVGGVVGFFSDLAKNMNTVRTSKRLTDVQAMQKELFMLVKRWMIDYIPVALPKDPTDPKAIKDALLK
jgi:hypothetical protein